jgi:hypothetical protein
MEALELKTELIADCTTPQPSHVFLPVAGMADSLHLLTYTLHIPPILTTTNLIDQASGLLILSVLLPSPTPNIDEGMMPRIGNSPPLAFLVGFLPPSKSS